MIKSYDFVPFLECKVYQGNGNMEGRIFVRVKALTPVHIFSGHFKVQDNGKIYREFIRINGRPVIPGTSFKGCVRAIAESISYSCLQNPSRNGRTPGNKRHGEQQKCIICDMFGSMGNKSKVRFGDLVAVNYKTEVRGIPRSFPPHPESNYYMENGKYKGYKFYKHGINGIQPTGPIFCEFVHAGSEFEGEIIFRGLTDEQVRLLCFALGLSGDVQPKIGYGKPYFYGSIEISSQPEWVNKAREYAGKCDDKVKKSINALVSILNYKNALRSYEG